MEFSSTGNGSSLGVQYGSPCSQTAELQGNLLLIWGDMHSISLSFSSSPWNLSLRVSWDSSGCQLWKLHSNYFKWKRTWLEESQSVLLHPASEMKPGSRPQLAHSAILSRDSTLLLMFLSLSFYNPLVQPPVFPTSPGGTQSSLPAAKFTCLPQSLTLLQMQCPSWDQSTVSRAWVTLSHRTSAVAL